jgi:uncharacterized damage-inducible protein DinB
MNDQRFLDLSAGYLATYLEKIRASVQGLSQVQLWWRPNEASNSVGNLVLHLCGNLSEWILASLGGVAYERQRDREFSAREGPDRTQLLARLAEVVGSCQEVIRRVSGAQLAERRSIRSRDVDGVQAIYHAVEHMAYHTGQIAFVAKQLGGKDLDLD